MKNQIERIQAAEVAKVQTTRELRNARAALNRQLRKQGSEERSLSFVPALPKR